MAGLKIFWRIASDAGVPSANSTAAGFPVNNLLNPTLTPSSSWASDGTQSTDIVTVDLGSPQNVTSFFWGAHDLKDTDTLTLRYASDSGFTADVGTITPTFYEDTLLHFFSLVARRYWRFEIVKSVGSETRTAARFMLGDHFEFTRSLALKYIKGPGTSTTENMKTKGAQIYSTLGVSSDVIRGSLIVDDTEKAELVALIQTYQTGFPFVAAVDYANYPIEKSLYGVFSSIRPLQDTAIAHWTFPWDQREQK